jgi:hypothetical protein
MSLHNYLIESTLGLKPEFPHGNTKSFVYRSGTRRLECLDVTVLGRRIKRHRHQELLKCDGADASAIRQSSAGQLESWIGAQTILIVVVLLTQEAVALSRQQRAGILRNNWKKVPSGIEVSFCPNPPASHISTSVRRPPRRTFASRPRNSGPEAHLNRMLCFASKGLRRIPLFQPPLCIGRERF